MAVFLSGGTGTPKLIQGAKEISGSAKIPVIVNVAENLWLSHGYLAPDIDTVIYTLGGIVNDEVWHGIKGDSFHAHETLKELDAGEFLKVGDKDRAVHIWRGELLKRGLTLEEITKKQCGLFGVNSRVVPASNDKIETRIIIDDGKKKKDVNLHEFLVNYNKNKVNGIKISGIEKAKACKSALMLIEKEEKIVIGPSNSITSISPIILIKEIGRALRKNKEKAVAISPIERAKPFSGPLTNFMKAKGFESSIFGVASLYQDFISKFIVGESEREQEIKRVEKLGIEVIKTNIAMPNLERRKELTEFVLNL